MRALPWLDPAAIEFPPGETALEDPPGLLAAGGDLSPARLEAAYAAGIFPWFDDSSPILWWCPEPRAVIRPGEAHVGRTLRRRLARSDYEVTMDRAFEAVIRACAAPRQPGGGTWITEDMLDAYLALHERGSAHSVEVWIDGRLAGGLYGVAIGRAFFGESMFTHVTDASKLAFVYLLGQLGAWGFPLVDCQMPNPHLDRLGVHEMPRREFLPEIRELVRREPIPAPWEMRWRWGNGEPAPA